MIGRLAYRCRRTFDHGVTTAWHRHIVRSRILKSEPIKAEDSSRCEIHVLTSEADWLNLVWALKSFYWTSGRRYGLCIHSDGTLSPTSRKCLVEHFPEARILNHLDSLKAVETDLKNYPKCLEFRRKNHLAPKVFDFRHHLQSERMLLLDSDVLFFREPTELLRRIESNDYILNSVNGDVASAYTVSSELAEKEAGVNLLPRFNSGLGVIHRDSLNLDWIEEFLQLPGILGHFWRIEQTLYALCSSRYGVELLPEEYDVFLKGNVGERPSRHYVGAIRHEMYREGMRKLVKQGFLKDIAKA
ncbi:hypothetical protein GYB59_15395 [bacterium]|nr:hypothetical protein [Planctomyces sp.]MBR9802981.1 hypothetical protein [bacterium]